ncbi:hypothetical protein JZO81_19265 [Enterococcus hulanensis]|uniref:hypothetical protein n=1 Tax=Enterococcus TaxID=1350 RepID=UPI000B5A3909|nr:MULTISPECIES: hypothetical protein [Enterococcus]MBO0413200.1 hypothetical protein [Enterococcus hulanensis]OTO15136.1 hypothetical protein A5875_004293 [Enterococcus sp. 3H8_DIV0648]
MNNQFITLYTVGMHSVGKIRVSVNEIVQYYPKGVGSMVFIGSPENYWEVQETPETIDQMIEKVS